MKTVTCKNSGEAVISRNSDGWPVHFNSHLTGWYSTT